jgi:hypothetical protein
MRQCIEEGSIWEHPMSILKLSGYATLISILGFALGARIMAGVMVFLLVLSAGTTFERLLSAQRFDDD